MARIALDAMGADAAPAPEIDAAVAAVRAHGDGLAVVLVGDAALLGPLLARSSAPSSISIEHAADVITMIDPPALSARGKTSSSMRTCFELARAGKVDAVVSAGSSGAMLACATLVLGRIPGAQRACMAAMLPAASRRTILVDIGANVEPRPEVLAQFALLGAAYARVTTGRPRPVVGLLSNGEEEAKGTELTREAHAVLRRVAETARDFNYVGYVEGHDLLSGALDVVATDGFTGNAVLKVCEATSAALVEALDRELMRSVVGRVARRLAVPALGAVAERFDYEAIGGAPLLGVKGVVLVCHGRSGARAISSAIVAAARLVENRLAEKLAAAIAPHLALWSMP